MFHVGQTAREPTALLALPLVVQSLHDGHAFVQIAAGQKEWNISKSFRKVNFCMTYSAISPAFLELVTRSLTPARSRWRVLSSKSKAWWSEVTSS
jgi:hypothetical protein